MGSSRHRRETATAFGLAVQSGCHCEEANAPAVIATTGGGGAVPAIASVFKLGSPFWLKITGSNFVSGPVAKINGTPAPSTDVKNAQKVLAGSGSARKELVPKGTAVQVTVSNTDGITSAPFAYSWWTPTRRGIQGSERTDLWRGKPGSQPWAARDEGGRVASGFVVFMVPSF